MSNITEVDAQGETEGPPRLPSSGCVKKHYRYRGVIRDSSHNICPASKHFSVQELSKLEVVSKHLVTPQWISLQ